MTVPPSSAKLPSGSALGPPSEPLQPQTEAALKNGALRVAAALVGTISFVGLVGVIGATVTWLRFKEAGIPASEAVSAIPPQDRIVAGTNALVYFMGFALVVTAVAVATPWSWLAEYANKRGTCVVTADEVRGFGVAALLTVAGVGGASVLALSGDVPAWRAMLLVHLGVVVLLALVISWRSVKARTSPGPDPRPVTLWSDWVAAGLAVAVPLAAWAVSGRADVALVIVAVAALGAVVFGVALAARRLPKNDAEMAPLWPTVLAVLLAVALYGGAWRAAELSHTPHVAPVGLIRELPADGHEGVVHQLITGVFVAATNDRIWIAGMDLHCSRGAARASRDSGRLISIPRDEVREYTVGVLGGWEAVRRTIGADGSLVNELRQFHESTRPDRGHGARSAPRDFELISVVPCVGPAAPPPS